MQGIGPDSTADILEKGKSAMVGEIREWSGKKYKKQANGKWLEVSEYGMTKKEHLESKRRANVSAETAFREARRSDLDKYEKEQDKHREAISKLSDEEVDIDVKETGHKETDKVDDVQFKKNVKMSEEWDSLYKKDKRELIQIFRSKVRVNNLSEREPKGEIVNAIMSERYYKQAWDYIPKSKR